MNLGLMNVRKKSKNQNFGTEKEDCKSEWNRGIEGWCGRYRLEYN